MKERKIPVPQGLTVPDQDQEYDVAGPYNGLIFNIKVDGKLKRRIDLWRDGEDFAMHRLPLLVTTALEHPGEKIWYQFVLHDKWLADQWLIFHAPIQTLEGNSLPALLE